jgi:DNA-directed RNA polymerase subunit RPC12/RpoP
VIARLDDIAQDVTSLSLAEQVWEEIENVARSSGANFELSERLRRLVCAYCSTANPVGEPGCIACGAPLGPSQPQTCKKCGFVVKTEEKRCPQCGEPQ